MEEETNIEEQEFKPLSPEKLTKIKNLKMFKNMSDDEIQEYFKNRTPKTPLKPPERPALPEDPEVAAQLEYDRAEYERKYKSYLQRYRREYDADMNDANDVQALEALVRFVIQVEVIDESIRKLQTSKDVDSRTLKNLGDFQRSVQMSINELQDRLGISRKSRKDRQADDFPAYVKQIQEKAVTFWKRQTKPVTCQKCQIELARFWLNFPDNVDVAHFEIVCEKCREKVVYSL
jgi:hypothetical protein